MAILPQHEVAKIVIMDIGSLDHYSIFNSWVRSFPQLLVDRLELLQCCLRVFFNLCCQYLWFR
jgi:hypothetical protein